MIKFFVTRFLFNYTFKLFVFFFLRVFKRILTLVLFLRMYLYNEIQADVKLLISKTIIITVNNKKKDWINLNLLTEMLKKVFETLRLTHN